MHPRTLLALALLALLQAGLLLREGRRDEPGPTSGRVVVLDRERIDTIEIQRLDRAPLLLSRARERWSISRPLEEPADPDAVERVLAAGEFLDSFRLAPEGVSEAQLGLGPPAVRVLLRAGAESQELRLGALDPSRQGVYLTTNGRRLVVARVLLDAVDRGLDDFRDHLLARLPREKLERLSRTGPNPLELARDGAGRWWQASAGQRLPVAPEAGERLVAALLALRATRFAPTPSAAAGAFTVRALAGSAGSVELRAHGACPGRPGEDAVSISGPGRRRSSVAACVDQADLAALRVPAESLTDLTLTRLDEPDLARVRIRSRSAALELRRESGLWQLPGGLAVERDGLRRWLAGLRAERGVLERSAVSATGEGSIELQREGGETEQLTFGRDSESPTGLLAQRAGMRGAVLRLGPEARKLLGTSPLPFRSLEPWRFSPEEARRLRLEGEGGALELGRRPTGWAVLRPAGASLEGERVQHLLEAIAHLRVARYLDERAPAQRPQRVYRLELDPEPLATSKAPRQHLLELWGGAEGGCRGRADGGPVFGLEECQLLLGEGPLVGP